MDINNIEYKPGLSSYGTIGKQGADGSNGNKFLYKDSSIISNVSTKDMSINDVLIITSGLIYNKSKQLFGSLFTEDIDLDEYYIDKYSSDGTISFNIDKADCLKEDGIHYELRNKYTNEIKTILGYE